MHSCFQSPAAQEKKTCTQIKNLNRKDAESMETAELFTVTELCRATIMSIHRSWSRCLFSLSCVSSRILGVCLTLSLNASLVSPLNFLLV